MKSNFDPNDSFGIRTVSQLTGVGQHTLRKWESRYKAVEVRRTETGRRVYSIGDVRRLSCLKYLVDQGETISRLASLSDDDLEQKYRMIQETSESQRITAAGGTTEFPEGDEPTLKAKEESASSATRIGVFGAHLAAKIRLLDKLPRDIEIVCCETSLHKFRSKIKTAKPIALMMETPLLNDNTVRLIKDLIAESDAKKALVSYRFGNRQMINRLREDGIVCVRNVGHGEELLETISTAIRQPLTDKSASLAPSMSDEKFDVIPARLFSDEALAELLVVDTNVDCECPHQLVELVSSLNAFEQYSSECASSSEVDAHLHDYLYKVTAGVRKKMEVALETLAIEEGLIPDLRQSKDK
ncbi:MAG: MerR family transcriptional regulator [Gammaproteobacteria bacterium]|nr:MerR family transcriptional regulator [Gammaproteobacteria bacterium]